VLKELVWAAKGAAASAMALTESQRNLFIVSPHRACEPAGDEKAGATKGCKGATS
jgi:hypothetical protein